MSIVKRVLVFGAFDGVHEGHLVFLRQVRQTQICADDAQMNADEKVWLVAAVARDEVVRKLKGRRPRKDIGHRTKDIEQTGLVDEVINGDAELESWGVIGKVKPDVIALGYDQVGLKEALLKYIREKGLQIEVAVMRAYKPEQYHSSLMHARH